MPNALTGTTQVSNLVVTAYDKLVEFALRGQPQFRTYATKKPGDVTSPGETVVFQLYNDLAPATAALDQYTDPDAVALPNTKTVAVVLNEYGNASITTRRMSLVTLDDVEAALGSIIAYNMADSMDILAQNAITGKFTTIAPTGAGGAVTVLAAGSGITYGTALDGGTGAGGANLVDTTHLLNSRTVRWAVTKLRARNVVPTQGQYYTAMIHPEVAVDLREETGAAAWREPNLGQDTIWRGALGVYEGAVFVENSRAYNGRVGVGGTARVYSSFFFGQQAIAEAVKEEPHVVIGNITDKLMRFRPIGWYGFLGWNAYRTEAAIQVLTSSSVRPGA
jgi:N4-gp56 family major capsid protein